MEGVKETAEERDRERVCVSSKSENVTCESRRRQHP
jgi:hypothetical protein